MKYKKANEGLSLIEIMIVVAIIGILAALAIPRFQLFQTNAKQAEAKQNLALMYTLQMSFHGDNDRYAVVDQLGFTAAKNAAGDPVTRCNTYNELEFKLTDCTKVRYNYECAANDPDSSFFICGASTGVGDDNKVFSGCGYADMWTMDQDKTLTNQIMPAGETALGSIGTGERPFDVCL